MFKYPVVRMKKELEEIYGGILAPYAVKKAKPNSRKVEEKQETFENRTDFQRDRDRIIRSSAFRRMMYKTQVFVNHEGDWFRTRLTHSLEVAQLSRAIAKSLALNEELAEAIALGHDLGHTPFGHASEGVFFEKLKSVGLSGFFHNEQSLRVVDVLENKGEKKLGGLNLTLEVREGILKHNGDRTGAFFELEPFIPCRSIEGQLIRLVDTAAYTCHDLDDGIKSGILEKNCICNSDIRHDFEDIKEKIKEICGIEISFGRYDDVSFISQLTSFFAEKITLGIYNNLSKYNVKDLSTVEQLAKKRISLAAFDKKTEDLFLDLKSFVNSALYSTWAVQMMDVKAEKLVSGLFDAFMDNSSLLPPEWKYKRDNYHKFSEYNLATKEQASARLVCDYISCMTDRFAIEEYDRVFDPKVKI